MQDYRLKSIVLLVFATFNLHLFAVGAPLSHSQPNNHPIRSFLPQIPKLGFLGGKAPRKMLRGPGNTFTARVPLYRNQPASVLPFNYYQKTESQIADVDAEYRKAVLRTTITVSAAIVFGIGIWFIKGRKSSFEFFAGYLVEQSLSVDNLFVFIMLFDYFRVPLQYQARVLAWGVAGAVFMRGWMIALGVAVVQRFRRVLLGFAAILLLSAYKLLKSSDDETSDLDNNIIMKLSRMCLRSTTHFDGERFFVKEGGISKATPLFMCLVCIELSDFVFAVDSIPAVIGVSTDPFIVYTSNIFAIIGLRSLYTLVARAVTDLPYLRSSVAAVLAFVGMKMVLEYFHVAVSTGLSLAMVVSSLSAGVLLSMWKKRLDMKKYMKDNYNNSDNYNGSNYNKGYDVRGYVKHDRMMV